MAEYGLDRLVAGKGAVIVGFSGGADSSCLLRLMNRYAQDNGVRICACHVNHMIRGSEADADQKFCEDTCMELGIPVLVYRLDVPAYALEKKIGLEEAARKLRYGAFRKAIEDLGSPAVVATAHNADDNLETVLFNMMRGAGTRGMCGISPVRDGLYIRPLIKDGAGDIRAWCAENGVSYVVDSTNSDENITRNRIRSKLIPEIKKISGGLDRFSRMTDIIRRDCDYIDSAARTCLSEGAKRIERTVLASLDPAVSSRVVREMYSNLKGNSFDLSYYHVAKALEISCGTAENTVDLPGNSVFWVDRHYAGVRMKEDVCEPHGGYHEHGEYEYSEEAPVFDNSAYRIEFRKRTDSGKESDDGDLDENIYKLSIITAVRFDKITGRLKVRSKSEGDLYRFGGMTRKVRKLLNAKKLTSREKELYPVVCDDLGILWIPGFPPREGTEYNGEGDAFLMTFREYGASATKN